MWMLWGFPSMQLSPLCGFPNACFTPSGRHVFQQVLYLCTTSHVEWQFTTYNYVSQVCSFTCADPVELQHLGLFHKVFFFFSHFTFYRLFTLGCVRVFYTVSVTFLSSALLSLFHIHVCGWSWPHMLPSYRTPVWGVVKEDLAVVWFLFPTFLINRSHHKALGVTLQCRLHSLSPEFVLFLNLWTLWFFLTGQQFLMFLFNMRRPWLLRVQAAVPLLVTETLFRRNLLCCSDVELWVVCRDKINVSNSA